MVRLCLFAICLASIFAVNLAENELSSNIEFTAVRNLTQFLKENPKIKLLRELKKEPVGKAQITYRLGNRVGGDRLVATATASQQWSTVQDVTLTLTYPRTGTGAVVSYVEVLVDQSSNVGRGYVVSGGIGQRQISVVIEAQRTLYFRHVSQIYGY